MLVFELQAVIGTFNQTPIEVQPLNSGTNVKFGSYAGDWIFGWQFAQRSAPGSFELVGEFGDDFIQGSTENDFLNGGFNSATPTFNSQQFATLENFASLQGFDVSRDIVLV